MTEAREDQGPDSKAILRDLQGLVKEVHEDLIDRVAHSPEITKKLEDAHSISVKRGQTSDAFEVWLGDYATQAAVSWVLACVFVRYIEDNGLVPECRLAGDGERRVEADEHQDRFFRQDPHASEREYLESVFTELAKLPALTDLFAQGKNPLWGLGPTGDGARRILQFLREIDPAAGTLKRTFRSAPGDTRFLGDLYQDLSEEARDKHALFQTPIFVEEFILDRTLNPAIDEFGLDQVRLIDPTCGSGHFLLGTFSRVFDLWLKREPNTNPRELARRALEAVWGVDINPFAVAIARFRLTVAANLAAGVQLLKDAPHWPIHLATGDSLLHGLRFGRGSRTGEREAWVPGTERYIPQIYAIEEPLETDRVLGQQYHAVVGNPPYIRPEGKALLSAYRKLYASCHGKYLLSYPFTERFFELALAVQDGSPAGYVGMITTSAFMTRESGKKLIEDVLARFDLTHVIKTDCVPLPGHGTSTAILLGRNRTPVATTVRAALSIPQPPSNTADPANSKEWRSIVGLIDQPGAENEVVSIRDLERKTLEKHPWSMGGGGAAELKETLDCSCAETLKRTAETAIGVVTLEDQAFSGALGHFERSQVSLSALTGIVEGKYVRDWTLGEHVYALFPYDRASLRPTLSATVKKYLWPFLTRLRNRMWFHRTQEQRGLAWYEYGMLSMTVARSPWSIAFAEIVSHNHFIFDRGGRVFSQTAPVIMLPADSTEDDYLGLVGLLNSSTACFWMKQVCTPKGGDHVGTEGARVRKTLWDERFAFSSTAISRVPVPDERPLPRAKRLDALGSGFGHVRPCKVGADKPTAPALAERRRRAEAIRGTMISLQEELDWECYRLYGILEDDLTFPGGEPPPLRLGERAFEIILARKVARGEAEPTWFERHGSTPITEIPAHWPEEYRRLVERRISVIESNRDIALIECPECKRRWSQEPWEEQEARALREWLLDRLESEAYWPRDTATPRLRSAGDIADQIARDHDFLEVAALWKSATDVDPRALAVELLELEAVPFLPGLRYRESGLRKRKVWEQTWEKQRAEDQGVDVGKIPVPPKYAREDFLKPAYFGLRGELDVPRERFISYPCLGRDVDPTPVYGWAGWNHLQQATALATYFDDRKDRDGWEPGRLLPILQGILELVPWLLQWHDEIEPGASLSPGAFYRDFVPDEARKLSLTVEDVRGWSPPVRAAGSRGGRKRKDKTGKAS